MGQGCCIPIDSGDLGAIENQKGVVGWRGMVQSVLDFEQMDQVLNRWRSVDISYFQHVYSKYATCNAKGKKGPFFSPRYLNAESLCKIFAGLTIPKRENITFDYCALFKPAVLKNAKNIFILNQFLTAPAANGSASSPSSSSPPSDILLPLHISPGNLLRAFNYAGFLSCSKSLEASGECIIPINHEECVDFRDFCHALAICSMGTQKEMLIFLFLLFADQSITTTNTGLKIGSAVNASLFLPSKTGKSEKLGRKSPKVAIAGLNALQSNDSSDHRSVDTDATGSTVSTIGPSTVTPTSVISQKQREAALKAGHAIDKKRSVLEVVPEQESDDTPSYDGKPVQSLDLGLSKHTCEAILQFCSLWQGIWNDEIPDVQTLFTGEIHTNDKPKCPHGPTRVETLLDKSKKLANSYLSLIEEFASKSEDSTPRPVVGNGAILTTPRNHASMYPMTLKSFLAGAMQASQISPPNSQPGAEEGFGKSLVSSHSLRRALRIFSLTTPPLQERAAFHQTLLLLDAKTPLEQVYVISSRWWTTWCQFAHVKPQYSDSLPGLVTGLSAVSAFTGQGAAKQRRNSRNKLQSSKILAKMYPKPELLDNSSIQDTRRPFLLRQKDLVAVRDYVVLSPCSWNVLAGNYSGTLNPTPEVSANSPIIRNVIYGDAGGVSVDLYPLHVYVHWCTALGVCTESALLKLLCCNCCQQESSGLTSRTGSRALLNSDDAVKSTPITGHASCCTLNEILTRFLEDHCLHSQRSGQATDGVLGLTLEDIRVWIQRIPTPSQSSQSTKTATDTSEASPETSKKYDYAKGTIPVSPYYQSRALSVVNTTLLWQLVEPDERNVPFSSILSGEDVCSIMIESKTVQDTWPTMDVFGIPKAKWLSQFQPARKKKIGDIVIARSQDGCSYPGTIQAVDLPSSAQEERYRVYFERRTSHSTACSWEEKIPASAASVIPKMTWAPALTVCTMLETPSSPMSETIRAATISNARNGEITLPAIDAAKTQRPNNSNSKTAKVSDGDLELFSRNASGNSVNGNKAKTAATGKNGAAMTNSLELNRYSVAESMLPLFRAACLRQALSVVPFIEIYGFTVGEIAELTKSRGGGFDGDEKKDTHIIAKKLEPTGGNDSSSNLGKKVSTNGVSIPDPSERLSQPSSRALQVHQAREIPAGVCGFWNMGNTCYMSAALQCLIHTPLLARYFLSGRYHRDLNRSNSFGTNGKLTDEFAALLLMLWTNGLTTSSVLAESGKSNAITATAASAAGGSKKPGATNGSSMGAVGASNAAATGSAAAAAAASKPNYVTPKSFKRVLDRTKSQFEGNHQQDTQEFLSALLDSLHEDLNKFDRKREELLNKQKQQQQQQQQAQIANSAEATLPTATAESATQPKKTSAGTSAKDGTGAISKPAAVDREVAKQSHDGDRDLQPGDLTGESPGHNTSTADTPPAKVDVNSKGEEAWENHLLRNKSVIVDMFQGQQCTEVRCRTCGTSSHTFDPFMSLSLPLPKQHEITIIVTVLRKMPRVRALMEQIYSSPPAVSDLSVKFKAEAKNFLGIYRNNRYPIRFCLTISRLAEVNDLKKTICKFIAARSKKIEESKGIVIRPLLEENVMITDSVQSSKDFLDLTRFLDDREPIMQLLESNPQKDATPGVIVFENCKDVPYVMSVPAGVIQIRGTANTVPTPSPTSPGKDKESTTSSVTVPPGDINCNSSDCCTDCVEYCSPENSCEGDVITDINPGDLHEGKANFPSQFSEITAGMRMDAQDSRGNWFGASVLEIWKVTSKELAMIKQEIVDSGHVAQAGSVPTSATTHIRIHFDNYSSKWDEWMSAVDFNNDRLAPIYTNSTRKVNFFEFIVYHRRGGLPTTSVDASDAVKSTKGSSRSPSESDAAPVVELVGVPFVVQVEPFRSCEHLYRHIVEQALRFANTEEVRSYLEVVLQEYYQTFHDLITSGESNAGKAIAMSNIRWPYEALPFVVRLASVANVACPGVPTILASRRISVGNGQVPTGSGGTTTWKFGREHTHWEGSVFPSDRNRPVCNLYHSKLCIVVDWKPLYRHSQSNPSKSLVDARFTGQDFDDDESYLAWQQNSVAAAKAAATSKSKERAGVSLQECLRAYAGQEELDENTWFCEKCNKHSKATVSTSLQLVPDTLIIHIKRFNMTARYGEKIRTLVSFPLQGLNLYPFTTEYKQQESDGSNDSDFSPNFVYDLYGVTNHIGHMNGGHYTAFVNCFDTNSQEPSMAGADALIDRLTRRLNLNDDATTTLHAEGLYGIAGQMASVISPSYGAVSEFGDCENRQWFLFDDETVEEIPPDLLKQSIVTDAAYLLFYRRRQLTPSSITNFIA